MLALVVLVGLALLTYYCRLFRYWDQGAPSVDYLRRRSRKARRMTRLYAAFRGQSVYGSPELVIRDLDVAKKVIVRDCGAFAARNAGFCPLGLFNASGPCWKALRFRLTPVFASAKTSAMFGLVWRTSERFAEFLRGPAMTGEAVRVDEVAYRFNADLLAAAVFGVDVECLRDPESQFLRHAKVLADGCSSSLVAHDVRAAERFFLAAVEAAVQQPSSEDKTFVQLLLEAARNNEKLMTAEWISVQACSFVVLGLRSLTLLLTASLVELARHREVQARLREEIREVQRAHGCKELSQAAVLGMTFMDRVVAETLRKWPPVLELVRETTQACSLPGTSLRLEAHTKVTVPVFAIHRDPEHFPDPARFDPDRFNDDANFQRHSCGYLPFGDGPRNCIGMRFAVLSAKACLAAILSELEFQTCDVDAEELDPFSYPEGKAARLRVSVCP